MEIRRATDGDREWAAELMASTDPWITLGRDRAQCLKALQRPGFDLHIASAEKRVGFLLTHPHGLAGLPYLSSLAVSTDCRSHGVGTRLLTWFEDRYRGRARWAFLCVSSFNHRAQELYRRAGYLQVGRLDDHSLEGAAELIMRKRPPTPRWRFCTGS
ncbi:MAG: GNAT family N-acetyltransferase [Armatimonadetes bacterium]|nr:GNAT family N-acetyltransferase [Armatimonadota bacterium]